MRKFTMFSVATLFIFFFVHAAFAQMAPPESTYGRMGTREIGLNGAIILPTSITIDGTSDDDGTTTITLQPFFKYFFKDRIHAGAQLLVQSSTTETDSEDYGTSVTVFSPHIGYTMPLSPTLQLDAQANLGFTSVEFWDSSSDISESALSYGLSFMALSPISESAVIGIGLILNWTSLDVEGSSYDVFTRVIPIQVSYYF